MTKKYIDNTSIDVVGENRITNAPPDVTQLNTARRWLLGASKILADASNGDELVDRIAGEAAVLANMTEIAIFGTKE
jgi:hypothetical protein